MDFSRSSSPLSSITNAISNVSSAVAVNNLFNSQGIYIGLIVVILVCVGIAYVLYYIISRKIFGMSKEVSKQTETPIRCNQKRQFLYRFDDTSNGERRTFTFWIYIHDLNVGRDMYKHVLSIQSLKDSFAPSSASPYIFLDRTNNRLYVRFATSSDNELIYYNDLKDSTTFNKFMSSGIVIPYVPLQRWVHVAIVCNANSYKNYIYAYIDGDLVNMTSTGEYEKIAHLKNMKKDLTKLNLNVTNYLNIGGDSSDLSTGPGFSGLIAKVTTFNYELNQQDIYDNYYEGPIGGLLAKLGLANYGLRNPVYKIS